GWRLPDINIRTGQFVVQRQKRIRVMVPLFVCLTKFVAVNHVLELASELVVRHIQRLCLVLPRQRRQVLVGINGNRVFHSYSPKNNSSFLKNEELRFQASSGRL